MTPPANGSIALKKKSRKGICKQCESWFQSGSAILNPRTGSSFIYYIAGTALILAFKVVLTSILLDLGLIIAGAYLITHIFVFIASLLYHARISFKSKITWNTAYRYFLAAVSVKLIDYFLVVGSVHIQILKATPAIVTSTAFLYAFRYFAARRAFERDTSSIAPYSEKRL